MNTIKVDKKNTKIIAHRGLSGIEVENTASAFVAAGNRSYYGIETDIHKTADGNFIIGHDDNYKRLSGKEIFLEKENLSTLEEIQFFDKDGTLDRVDLRPCRLESYLKIVKKYEKQAILELKSDFSFEEISKIIDIIKSFDFLENVTFISFSYDNLLKVREILPNQSAQYLFWKMTDEELARLHRDKIDADVWCREITKEQIEKAHALGIIVNCWTVDTIDEADKLINWGIDYITSNILE
jgi:glycerophosphoryl diester phosphodiesterase